MRSFAEWLNYLCLPCFLLFFYIYTCMHSHIHASFWWPFPDKPGLAVCPLILFLHIFWNRTSVDSWHRFFAGLSSLPVNQLAASESWRKETRKYWCQQEKLPKGFVLLDPLADSSGKGIMLPLCLLLVLSYIHSVMDKSVKYYYISWVQFSHILLTAFCALSVGMHVAGES